MNELAERILKTRQNSNVRPLAMNQSHVTARLAKLSDAELSQLAAQPGLQPEVAAAVALEREMRRITPAQMEGYRAQVLKEYAGLRATRRERSPRASRVRLWQARGFSIAGAGSVLFGLASLIAGRNPAVENLVIVIFGSGMLLAGLVLASSAKAELAAFGRKR